MTISGASNSSSERSAAVSLLFSQGKRPSPRDIRALVGSNAGFSISFDPEEYLEDAGAGEAPTWLELLASGLTFDLSGLAPGAASDAPPHRRNVALEESGLHLLESITLLPGPHLSGGVGMLPIIRTLASLAASLTRLEGIRAVAWHPSRCWIEPGLYRDGVLRWVEGGVFPGLTLASLAVSADGGMHSEGLALFTGQELRLDPEMVEDPAEAAKLAVRLLDHLIERGKVETRETIVGPDGMPLRLEPAANGQFVRICRG